MVVAPAHYLDKAFAKIAAMAGNPYIVLATAALCVTGVRLWDEGKLDITLSITTLLLDMIIINQGNKSSAANTKTLARIQELEESILAAERTILDAATQRYTDHA